MAALRGGFSGDAGLYLDALSPAAWPAKAAAAFVVVPPRGVLRGRRTRRHAALFWSSSPVKCCGENPPHNSCNEHVKAKMAAAVLFGSNQPRAVQLHDLV